jgi:hypothetical protein
MDIGDLIRSHQWAGIVNAYWHPLYAATLALGHSLFHATRFTELHAYYMVNFGIFVLEMLAVVAFTDAIIRLRDERAQATDSTPSAFILDKYILRYLGLALLVIASQRKLSLGKVRPDALLQAMLFFGLAALLRHLATARLHYAALMASPSDSPTSPSPSLSSSASSRSPRSSPSVGSRRTLHRRALPPKGTLRLR